MIKKGNYENLSENTKKVEEKAQHRLNCLVLNKRKQREFENEDAFDQKVRYILYDALACIIQIFKFAKSKVFRQKKPRMFKICQICTMEIIQIYANAEIMTEFQGLL